MYKAVIFDCFGVLITDALQAIREQAGKRDQSLAQEITDIAAANNRGLMEPAESNERIAAILGITSNELRTKVAAGEVKNTELLAYIPRLRQRYKTAMLSNIAGSSLRKRFTVQELEAAFDLVVASGDIGWAKPEPEAYQITAEKLGVRCDECIFTDDRELFVEAACAVGMQGIVYTNFVQFKVDLEKILGTGA